MLRNVSSGSAYKVIDNTMTGPPRNACSPFSAFKKNMPFLLLQTHETFEKEEFTLCFSLENQTYFK